MEHVKRALGVDGCFSVYSNQSCTGLALLWKSDVDVSLLPYSNICNDAIIHSNDNMYRFIEIHGYADPNVHMKTWQLLDRLKAQSDLPWLVGGDINEILQNNEKQGGRRRPNYLIQHFREALDL
ncbi:hypothetical protein GQ457_02G019560 [Hibiscus cannabinus]